MRSSPSLEGIPLELLESIALFAACDSFLGPPSSLVGLLSTNRLIYSQLSIHTNHYLYASIFAFKFDEGSLPDRIGSAKASNSVLTLELIRRFTCLKQIRNQKGCRDSDSIGSDRLRELLFQAYLLMLEDGGKNVSQLRDYADINRWLHLFWFDEEGASGTKSSIRNGRWPAQDDNVALAMWLFWFMLRKEDYTRDSTSLSSALNVLKVYALGAHVYHLTWPSWTEFVPNPSSPAASDPSETISHYAREYRLSPPPLATPAILSYLALLSRMQDLMQYTTTHVSPQSPTNSKITRSREWECEWERCVSLGRNTFDNALTGSFKPGSIEGVWEGYFTYTEFTSYASLLSGAPPSTLQKTLVVHHRQTWKLREHHLVVDDTHAPDTGPLEAGDPLHSYFPPGTHIFEHPDHLEVQQVGRSDPLHYRRASMEIPRHLVRDIIITGEGHSAWGQFNLIGRVRPCDGFVSLSKEYVDGDRGKWLYRGYLVGNSNGHLAGRWRDTVSPVVVAGYEGCFIMTTRK